MRILLVCVAALAVVSATPARGVNFAYVTDAATVAAAPGAVVSVPIYLEEVGGPSRLAAEGGLYSAGFAVRRAAPDGASIAGIAPNGALFDDVFDSASTAGVAGIWEQQNGDLFGTGAFPSGGRILLGSVTLQASTVAGQLTAFSIEDFSPQTGQVVTYDGSASLDALIDSGTFTVATTPEPAASLAAVLCLAAVARRRRPHRRCGEC